MWAHTVSWGDFTFKLQRNVKKKKKKTPLPVRNTWHILNTANTDSAATEFCCYRQKKYSFSLHSGSWELTHLVWSVYLLWLVAFSLRRDRVNVHICKPWGGVMHSEYICSSKRPPPQTPTPIPSTHCNHNHAFSAHLFQWRAINHLHSPPPVSLCCADQLDQSALRKKEKKSGSNPRLANKMALFNVDLWGSFSLYAQCAYLAVPV